MGRYSKNTSGQRQAVFVSPAIEYSDSTTLAAFIDEAVEGEIGVFLADGTLRTTLLTAGTEFIIAQKRDAQLHKTQILKFNDIYAKRKTAYDAPAKKVMTIGYDGTTAIGLGLDFTGVSASNPQTVGISVRDTSPGNQPFPVQEARVVVTRSTQNQYAVVASLVSQLNGEKDFENVFPDRFVLAEIISGGTKTNLTNGATVTLGSTAVTSTAHGLAANAYVELRDVVYKVVSVTTNAFVIDRPYQGVTEVIAAGANAASIAYTDGTTNLGIRLTGILPETHFVVTTEDGLANATVTTTTAWKLGAGYGANIQDLEKEGIIFAGLGSIPNTEFYTDYGYPTLFATAAGTYDQVFLDLSPSIRPSAAPPVAVTQGIFHIVIAAPTGGGATPTNELSTIFGV